VSSRGVRGFAVALLLVLVPLPASAVTAAEAGSTDEASPPDTAASVAVPGTSDGVSFEVAELARDRRISRAAAAKRLHWQEAVPVLMRESKSQLDKAFGGVWVDPDDGDRIKIAVTGDATPADRSSAERAATEHGVAAAVDVVLVEHSEAELRAVLDRLAAKVAEVHDAGASSVSVGLRPDRNAVMLHLPPHAEAALPARLAGLVELAKSFGDRVQIRYDGVPVAPLACVYNTYCDPPLRGGIRIWTERAGCTAAFVGRSRTTGSLYQFTAGHCATVSGATATWWTHFSDGSKHFIGPMHNHKFNSSGDMGIMRINNPAGWDPKAWVLVTAGPDTGAGNFAYRIKQDAKSVVGQRVCSSGASTAQTTCGTVTELDASMSMCLSDGRCQTMRLNRATTCVRPGDSGSPVYANHTAYGIVSGGAGCGNTVYQDIQAAENLMNTDVAHG
jgi:hypothetical protein